MNELQLIAQTLVAQGGYSGAVVSAQQGDNLISVGAGNLRLGQLAIFVLANYIRHVPEDKRDVMLRYISEKAKKAAKDAPSEV